MCAQLQPVANAVDARRATGAVAITNQLARNGSSSVVSSDLTTACDLPWRPFTDRCQRSLLAQERLDQPISPRGMGLHR